MRFGMSFLSVVQALLCLCITQAPGGDDIAFVDALQDELILAVPGRGFGMAGFVRLSCSVDEKIIARSAEGFKRAVAKLRG